MGSMGEGKLESLKNLCTKITEKLGPRGMETLRSLIENFNNYRTEHTEFRNSIQLLFDNHAKTQQHHVDTELEDGETREHHAFAVSAKVDDSLKEYPIHHGNLKIGGAHVGTRVKVDENPRVDAEERESEKYATSGLLKMNLERNNGSNLHSDEQIGRSLMKKRRTYMRLNRETPNYKLIPEEEQCPVKYEVLNNKVSLVKFDACGHKNLTEYEKAMAKCEEEMCKADVSMESLRSAVEKAEKVIKGEMRVKDLGVMFYACIKKLCHLDVFERVRQDYKKALPKILPRLKQKLDKLTVARAEKKFLLKQVMEDNTAKQRDSTAQGQGEKQHTFVSDFIYPLHKKDEFLHQRFLEATNELKQEQEDANGETQDVKVDDESAKEDPHVHVESNLEADLENPKEDVTLEITPSYELIPAEERSLAVVSGTVLNNEFRQVKVETPRPKKLIGYKKHVADYEDERYQNDMMIEYLTSAVEHWEKVMRKEMRIEDVEEKFYTCIEELDRGGMIKKLKQNYQEALPVILYRLKEKLTYQILTRETKNSRWKQIESTEKARSRKRRRLTI
ncbi:unnamed protein product [Brassica rapa]|uniref:Histone deacetylase interacting domain-containing protein n=1 Tax=Brassica campestris TaxID=3711 RepID=A0A8D9HKQ0_BRACM|nr:unnamed protein product [Brassica rapa]